jgi:hypothetical protein
MVSSGIRLHQAGFWIHHSELLCFQGRNRPYRENLIIQLHQIASPQRRAPFLLRPEEKGFPIEYWQEPQEGEDEARQQKQFDENQAE